MSPLLDLTDITLFADDNYALVWNTFKEAFIISILMKLELIKKWLLNSGLKVNEAKTELCIFHRKDNPPITISFNNKTSQAKTPWMFFE